MEPAESRERSAGNQYRYPPLPQGYIRLLRLLPSEERNSHIQGCLFNYPLERLAGKTHLYEAISYVWGDLNDCQSISLEDCDFPVTANLHTALLHIRDPYIERIIWIDAVCINQKDLKERGEQVRRMAEIYIRAKSVIVWLGNSAHYSDEALEKIRIAAHRPHSVDDKFTKEAVFSLLQRPWFKRIWVLQEVAAARQILIKCGATEMDGYVFCVGLTSGSFESLYKDFPELQAVVLPVAFLMRESLFRPKVIQSISSEFSLNIRPLSDLLEMYHTREATRQHDKLFALLGMCSDESIPTDLLPDYSTPWATLFARLVRFLLGRAVYISTHDQSECALISGWGYILGKVLSAKRSQREDGQEVSFATKDTDGSFGPQIQWHLPALAKPVQVGDLVCQLQEAAKPTIIRLCRDNFSIIMIAAPLELQQPKHNTLLTIPLSWDWQDPYWKLSDQKDAQSSLNSSLPRYSGHQHGGLSGDPDGLWRAALVLEAAEEYRIAADKFQQALSGYKETMRANHTRKAACRDKLTLMYKRMGLLYAEQSETVPEELYGLNPLELGQLKNWTFKLKFKQEGVISYGTAFSIAVPNVEKTVLLTARCNLIDKKGHPSQDLEIYNEHGRVTSISGHIEVFLSACDPNCASNTSMDPGYGALLVDMKVESHCRGYGFALMLGQTNLKGNGLGVCGYPNLARLSRSTGLCLSCQNDRMTYNAIVMPGMSGSPVFLSHNGYATAVGIHIDPCGVGGWCVRLTAKVLEEIFGWASAIYTNKCLRVFLTGRASGEGGYLHFPPDCEYGIAVIDQQVPPTTFDILPSYASSATGHIKLYVFRFRVPPRWPRPKQIWVQWNITNSTVRLTSSLRQSSSVKLHSMLERGQNVFRVSVEDSQLMMRVPLSDQQNRRAYPTEILFYTSGTGTRMWRSDFNHFIFELGPLN